MGELTRERIEEIRDAPIPVAHGEWVALCDLALRGLDSTIAAGGREVDSKWTADSTPALPTEVEALWERLRNIYCTQYAQFGGWESAWPAVARAVLKDRAALVLTLQIQYGARADRAERELAAARERIAKVGKVVTEDIRAGVWVALAAFDETIGGQQ